MYLYNGCTYVGGCQRAFCWLLHRYMIYVLSVLSVCALQAHRNVPNLKVAELFFTMMVNNLLSKEDSIELISALSLSLYLSCFRLSCLDSMCLCLFSTYVCELSTHTKKKRSRWSRYGFKNSRLFRWLVLKYLFQRKKRVSIYVCVCGVCVCVFACAGIETLARSKGEFLNPASFAQQSLSWAFAEVYPSTLYHSWVPLSFLLRASLFCGSSAEKKYCIQLYSPPLIWNTSHINKIPL